MPSALALSRAKLQFTAAELQEIVNDPNRWITEVVASPIIGVSVTTMRRWRIEKRGPRYAKTGSRVHYRVCWLLEYVARCVVETRDSAQESEVLT